MAHTEEMLIRGVMRPVIVFDSSAQEIDDAAPGDDAVIPGSGGGGGHGGNGGAGGNGAPGLVLIYH